MIAALFGAAMFCAPLVAAIPSLRTTAPALILVGALMCGSVAKVRWDDYTLDSVPAFLTLDRYTTYIQHRNRAQPGTSVVYLPKTFHRPAPRNQPAGSGVLSVLFLLRYALFSVPGSNGSVRDFVGLLFPGPEGLKSISSLISGTMGILRS